MKIIQTTLTRTQEGAILVHGSEEDMNLDCIVAHTVTPTFMKVREIAEAEGALADPIKALTAIREAFQNPTLFGSEDRVVESRTAEAVVPSRTPDAAPGLRPGKPLTSARPPEGFGRILSHQETADMHFPEYRERINTALAQLEHYRHDMPAEAFLSISEPLRG